VGTILNLGFLGWVVLLAVKGLQKEDNWLGWFMFSRARYFQATLRDKGGEVDIWDYLPHCQVMLSQRQIESLLRHIQTDRKHGYLEGTVRLFLNEGEKLYTIRRALLIPQDEDEV
jgi:hypothetical protein